MGTGVVLTWYPPNDKEDVAAYAIRWGILDDLEEGSASFPIDCSTGFFWVLPNSSAEKQEYSFHVDIEEFSHKYIAAQVVALCEDQALQLPGYSDRHKGIHNVTISAKLVNEIFIPARYDVPYHPDTGLAEEIHASPEDSLKVVSPSAQPLRTEARDSEGSTPTVTISTAVSRQQSKHQKCGSVLNNLERNPIYKAIYINIDEADRWELSRTCIEWGEEIGCGAFGSVFKCLLHKEKSDCCTTVAVKVLTADSNELSRQQFIQEIMVMKDLERHPNILQLVGCITLSGPVYLVMDYAANGDLLSFLHQQRAKSSCMHSQLLKMAIDVTVGMEYISSRGYVHRDLAARNLLLDEDFSVKIGDFGLARHLHTDDVYIVQCNKRLPAKWLSIEALAQLRFSTASDVWAFGVVLYELFSLGETPYSAIDSADILKYLTNGHRMARPMLCDENMYEVMMQCWQTEPGDRPSFTQLHQQLSLWCDTLVIEEKLQERTRQSPLSSSSEKPTSHDLLSPSAVTHSPLPSLHPPGCDLPSALPVSLIIDSTHL
ncbi:hypothetical protein EB796_021129 [Bugula neritina]|uniref:Protein kinase domain-containing protein n=1 Tax=Bugula neritina TaxID=10212 RepID=A0A7J7J4G6_BUGNE|nr:hypothetical protein EB796_021129 [Bugula neritina]